MERVLWPMEPVEPRIASFFTFSIFADLKARALGGPPFLNFARFLVDHAYANAPRCVTTSGVI